MALFGNIPLPQHKDMFEGLMDQWIKQKELHQTNDYQQGMLNVYRQAEARSQKELPYLLEAHTALTGKNASEARKQEMMTDLLQKELEKMGFGKSNKTVNPSNPLGAKLNPEKMAEEASIPETPKESMKMPSPMPGGAFPVSQPGQPLKFSEPEFPDEVVSRPQNAPNSAYKEMEKNGMIPTAPLPQPMAEPPLNLQDNVKQSPEVDPVVASLIKSETGLDLMAQTPLQQELTKSDAKQVGDWGKSIETGHVVKSNLDQMQDLVTSPVMDSMKNNPQFFGKDIAYYKNFGTDEQKELLGNLVATNKSMYKEMAQGFKGSFRVGEQALVGDMLVNEKDTLPVMIGKMNGLKATNELKTGTHVISRTANESDLKNNAKQTSTGGE